MVKHLSKYGWVFVAAAMYGCNMFASVDPLPPSFSSIEVVDIKRNEITLNGTIRKPDSKNDRQEKKSGEIMEYGIVYATNENLNVESSQVVKLGTTGVAPLTIQNQKITGLTANTQYFIAIYARNEGGGLAYSEIVKVKTTDQPGIFTSKVSVKVSMSGGLFYDLDKGEAVSKDDSKADVSMESFTITGRGTVLTIAMSGGTVFKNLGIIDFNGYTYLNLLNTTDYLADNLSILMNASTANTVIAFKTKEGRLGKWRIESLTGNDLTMSLITYDN